MRFVFASMARPKAAAKEISRQLLAPLSACQNALADVCGYRDWHDLHAEVANAGGRPSPLDQDLSPEVFRQRQVALVLALAHRLGRDQGDVQLALLDSHLTGSRPACLEDQLAIRALCLRKTELPDAGPRKPGSIGRIRSRGWGNEPVILRSYGAPTRVLTHNGPAMCASFEYIARRERDVPVFIPLRLYLAYGVWTEADGAKVLFSRDYCPLWRLRQGKRPEPVDPWERIRWVNQEWFWKGNKSPWDEPECRAVEVKRLKDFGVRGLPRLVNSLPALIYNPEAESIKGAVALMQKRPKAA